jgi:hypothetical protein
VAFGVDDEINILVVNYQASAVADITKLVHALDAATGKLPPRAAPGRSSHPPYRPALAGRGYWSDSAT